MTTHTTHPAQDPAATLLERVLSRDVPPYRDAHITAMREVSPRAYALWSPDEEQLITALRVQGLPVGVIAALIARQGTAVDERLVRLAQPRPDPSLSPSACRVLAVNWLTESLPASMPTAGLSGLAGYLARQRPRMSAPWTAREERCAQLLRLEGRDWSSIARHLGRPLTSVLAALQREQPSLWHQRRLT